MEGSMQEGRRTNPAYCFNWLTQVEALVNDNKGRNYREELLFNFGISVTKMIQAVPQGASHQEIKDAVLRNHSDLRIPSQRSNAYQNLYQKPDEALQTYNTRDPQVVALDPKPSSN